MVSLQRLSRPLLLDRLRKGRFIKRLSDGEGNLEGYNFLGIELYKPLVEEALTRCKQHESTGENLHYIAGRADRVLEKVGSTLPNLQRVTIQFSDPWGERHMNRRMVDPSLATRIAALLPKAGRVYISSDFEEVATSIQLLSCDQGHSTSTNRLRRDCAEAGRLAGRCQPSACQRSETKSARWRGRMWRLLLCRK